jgi:thiol-disulfide isomerase/thioredoxin
MTGGIIALVAALVAATALGLGWRWRAGRFRTAKSGSPTRLEQAAGTVQAAGTARTAKATGTDVLTEADLGSRLGREATLVQFSTAFCAPCRPTRQILAQVAGMADGVTQVEIDAAERLDLVRRLRINSTPTVLVLGPDGAIVKRAVGLPRKADVIAALGTAIEPSVPGAAAPVGGEPT